MAIQKRNDELVDILSSDFLRKRLPLAVITQYGGMINMTLELLDGTTVVIVDLNLFDAVGLLHYSADVSAPTGDSRSVAGMIGQNESINLFDVSGDTVQLRVTVSGQVELQRTAGTETYNIALRLHWITEINSITSKYFTFIADKLIGFHVTKLTVDAAESHTIDSGHQLLVHGAYTINGSLVNNGQLVIL